MITSVLWYFYIETITIPLIQIIPLNTTYNFNLTCSIFKHRKSHIEYYFNVVFIHYYLYPLIYSLILDESFNGTDTRNNKKTRLPVISCSSHITSSRGFCGGGDTRPLKSTTINNIYIYLNNINNALFIPRSSLSK